MGADGPLNSIADFTFYLTREIRKKKAKQVDDDPTQEIEEEDEEIKEGDEQGNKVHKISPYKGIIALHKRI